MPRDFPATIAANEARQARRVADPDLDSNRDAELLAEMLLLPNDGRYPGLELAAQRGATNTGSVLQVEALSRQDPVLMIFEDAHWADPTSLEVWSYRGKNSNPSRVADRDLPARV